VHTPRYVDVRDRRVDGIGDHVDVRMG
jgi:hypothetical protein